MSSTGNQLRQRVHTGYKSGKDDLRKDAETELKRFIETNGQFSLVRYVYPALTQQLSPRRRVHTDERVLRRAVHL